MSSRTIAAVALAVAIAPGAAHAADMARATVIDPEGAVIGQATFEQTPTGVLVFVDVRDLPPGAHGIHLHAVGSCTPDFKAATGHINPGKSRTGCATRTVPTTETSRTSMSPGTAPRGRSSSQRASRSREGRCRRFWMRTARR